MPLQSLLALRAHVITMHWQFCGAPAESQNRKLLWQGNAEATTKQSPKPPLTYGNLKPNALLDLKLASVNFYFLFKVKQLLRF